jgi:hypothetical protein
MKKSKIEGYDYEDGVAGKRADDFLSPLPKKDPKRHKSGVVGFTLSLISFCSAFIKIYYFSLALSMIALYFCVEQFKYKKTKIGLSGLALSIIGIAIFCALTIYGIAAPQG